jgi:hypothetical protein
MPALTAQAGHMSSPDHQTDPLQPLDKVAERKGRLEIVLPP